MVTVTLAVAPTLKPFSEVLYTWFPLITVMTFVGVGALALFVVRPLGQLRALVRLNYLALAAALLAIPALITLLNHADGFDRLGWIRLVLLVAAAVLIAVGASPVGRTWLLPAGSLLGLLSLVLDDWPTKLGTSFFRTAFSFVVWVLHLGGASVWIGGLVGLLFLSLPGGITGGWTAFWGPALAAFSRVATIAVASIILSGLWLYWVHIDGFHQLVSTLYGKTLGVKLIIAAAVLIVAAVNQYWLMPRLNADEPTVRQLISSRFRFLIAAEVIGVLAVLMVAPFLSGSARNQQFQANYTAQHTVGGVPPKKVPKAPQVEVKASTWIFGTIETVAILGITGSLVVLSASRRPEHGILDQWTPSGTSPETTGGSSSSSEEPSAEPSAR